MGKNNYFELLKHPNWQKKRLEIFERAGFECEDCGSNEDTLHVHHSYYKKDLAPWEYPSESLHCLCEKCHKKAQDTMDLLKEQLGKISLSDNERLLGYARALETQSFPMVLIDVFSYEMAQGVADAWNLTPEEVIHALREREIDGDTLNDLVKSKKKRRCSSGRWSAA